MKIPAEIRLVPDQTENGKYNLISVDQTRFGSRFTTVMGYRQPGKANPTACERFTSSDPYKRGLSSPRRNISNKSKHVAHLAQGSIPRAM